MRAARQVRGPSQAGSANRRGVSAVAGEACEPDVAREAGEGLIWIYQVSFAQVSLRAEGVERTKPLAGAQSFGGVGAHCWVQRVGAAGACWISGQGLAQPSEGFAQNRV